MIPRTQNQLLKIYLSVTWSRKIFRAWEAVRIPLPKEGLEIIFQNDCIIRQESNINSIDFFIIKMECSED